MFKFLIVLFAVIGLNFAKADCSYPKKIVRIGIIDTGFGYKDQGHEAQLCHFGHKDFTKDQVYSSSYDSITPVPVDRTGHGTNIAGIIDSYNKNTNYCFVIIKYFTPDQTNVENVAASLKALKYAANLGLEVINYSGGGPVPDYFENKAVKEILDNNHILVAAAGNDGYSLDTSGAPDTVTQYPAMYDTRIVVVGNRTEQGYRDKTSNYGDKVNRWDVGENVTAFGITMSGTSQATAVATGKIVAEMTHSCVK